jgi:hypothetical protein
MSLAAAAVHSIRPPDRAVEFWPLPAVAETSAAMLLHNYFGGTPAPNGLCGWRYALKGIWGAVVDQPSANANSQLKERSASVRAISQSDLGAVAEFLSSNMHAALSSEEWLAALSVPWQVDAPNHGFMLLAADTTVVGAYIAFYSDRLIGGRAERFCNLGTWCVIPDYRLHSVRLLRALLNQPGYHFTDLTPSPGVQKLNARLGFRSLDPTLVVVRPRHWPLTRVSFTSAPDAVEELLTGTDLDIYQDHKGARAAHHVVVSRGYESCYVIYRKAKPGRVRRVPYVSLTHVSNPRLLGETAVPVARYLLRRHGALALHADLRMLGEQPRYSSLRRMSYNTRMYRSTSLEPEQIDYLYSELMCVS